MLMEDYKSDQRLYERRDDAMNQLRVNIQEHVSEDHQYLTHGCAMTREILVSLKDFFAPIDYGRERDLVDAWQRIRKRERGYEVKEWISKWKTLYNKCVKAQIPNVYRDRPVRDFLALIYTVLPGFTQ